MTSPTSSPIPRCNVPTGVPDICHHEPLHSGAGSSLLFRLPYNLQAPDAVRIRAPVRDRRRFLPQDIPSFHIRPHHRTGDGSLHVCVGILCCVLPRNTASKDGR